MQHFEETAAACDALTEISPDDRHVVTNVLGGLNDTQYLCHMLARRSGWWNNVDPKDKNVLGTKICLMHSELSEALEGVRKDKMDDHLKHRPAEEVELADALIRIFDYAGVRQLDLAGAVIEKLAYNQKRADHKPENRALDGGKKI
jgi:NTP pyrophosphatase (non-canonical NTP hydrolase)